MSSDDLQVEGQSQPREPVKKKFKKIILKNLKKTKFIYRWKGKASPVNLSRASSSLVLVAWCQPDVDTYWYIYIDIIGGMLPTWSWIFFT